MTIIDPLGNPDSAGVSAAMVLSGVSPSGEAGLGPLDRVRLDPRVGAALRTALDHLQGDPPARRPLRARADGGVLEVRCEAADPAGIASAASLIEAAGGHLAPSGSDVWTLRVPTFSEAPTYLMVMQGSLGLAIPWHTVVRVRIVDQDAEGVSRGLEAPALPPYVVLPASSKRRVAVLIGLGLRRAWLLADQLIWRMGAAEIERPEPAPGPVLERAVRAEDGEVFWVVDPARALRDVEPQAPPRGESPAAGRRSRGPAEPPRRTAPRPASAPPLRLIELRPEDVEPLGPIVEPEPPPHTAPPPPPEASAPAVPSQVRVPAPRALIAEDAITARIFLERLLRQHGFDVHVVTTAAGLEASLRGGRWDAVFADVDLPDARIGQHLVDLRARIGSAPLIALTRDSADETLALALGVARALRKPFEPLQLVALLGDLGFAARR